MAGYAVSPWLPGLQVVQGLLALAAWLLLGMFVAHLSLLVWLLPQHVAGYAVSPWLPGGAG